MDKELEYIYNTLASMSPKYREMGAGEFYNKLENDAEFYKKVYSWASASKLPLTELGNIEPVKKKEPTPSSSGVSPSSESEPAPTPTPEKPKVSPPQVPSILPPNYLKGTAPAADGTKVVTPTPQQYQEIAKVKGYSKPQYTTKEMRAVSNNLLQNQNKQQFFTQNPQATEFDYMRQQAEQNRQQQSLKQSKELEEQQYGYKPDGKPDESFYGLKIEGNAVKFGTPKGSYVDPNEQLAVAVSVSPLASKQFKEKFAANKGDIVEMFAYMPEQRKNQVRDLIRYGKYDEFKQISDLNDYYASKTQLMSDDFDVLKDRMVQAQLTQNKELFDVSKGEIEQVSSDYEAQLQKNKELIGLFPKVAEEQTKELVKQATYSTMNAINPETQFLANIGQGLVNSVQTAFVTLPKSILLLGTNATDAIAEKLTGNSVFSDDFKKFEAYTLDDISNKIKDLATFTPKVQNDVYKYTQEVSQVLGEMFFVYNKGASVATRLMGGSQSAGVFTTAFLHSYGDSYIQGIKEYGLTPEEANLFASMVSVPQAALEGIFPDAKAFDWTNKDFAQNIITRVIRGNESFGNVFKGYVKDLGINTVEELLQDAGANAGQNAFSIMADKPTMKKVLFAKDAAINTIGITLLTSGLSSSPKLFQSRSFLDASFSKGMTTLASMNEGELMNNITNLVDSRIITQDQARGLLEKVGVYKNALNKLPQDIKANTKFDLVPLLLHKQMIEDTIKKMTDAIVGNENSGIDPVILEVENGKIKKSIGDLEKQLQVVTDKIKKIYGDAESKEDERAGFGAEPSETDAGRPVGGEERPVSEDSGLGVTDTGVAEEAKPTAEPTATEGQAKPVSEPLGSEAPQAEAEKTQQTVSNIDAEIERLKKDKDDELNRKVNRTITNEVIETVLPEFGYELPKLMKDGTYDTSKINKILDEIEAKINAKYDKQIAELETKKKTEQTQKQNEQAETTKENVEPVSEGVSGVRTETEAGKESTELRAEGKEEVTPQAGSVVGGENPALANVEATAKALEGKDITTIISPTEINALNKQSYNNLLAKINELLQGGVKDYKNNPEYKAIKEQIDLSEALLDNDTKAISEAYHKAKADNSNPQLVEAVEQLLGKPKQEATQSGAKEVKQDTVPEKARKKLNSFKEKKGVKTEQKESEEKQNAVQEPSTEKEVPPTGEGGKNKSQGGEGVGQSKQGKEAAQQGETKKEIIPNGSQIKVKSSTTGAVTTYTYANGKWTFVDSNNRTNNETAKMNETLSTSFMQGDNERVRTSDELKAMSAVNNIKNSLKSSGIEVKVIDNEEEFDKEANKQKSGTNDNVGGMFLSDDGVIYLNGKKLVGEWGDVIAWHEGIHPVINILRNTNPKLLDRIMRGAEQFAKGNPQLEGVRKFAEQYRMDVNKNADGKYDVVDDGEVVATFDSEAEANSFVDAKVKDEFITELFARITAGDIKLKDLPTGFKQTLIELINKILKALKIDINVSALNEAEFNKYARMISETLSEGRDISEIVGEENVGEYQNNLVNEDGTKFSQFSISNKFKNLISGVKYEYISDTEEFLELIKNGRITNDKFLKDFNEFYVMLHIPDNAFTGKIYKDGELLVDGKGGVYFPIRYNKEGYFWASTEAAVDKLVAILNETRKANPDQKVRLALVSSRPDKIMSSANASNAMIDVLFSKALDKRAQLTDVQVKESIINGLETAQIQIIEDFNEDIKKAKEKIAKEEDVTVKEKLQKSLDEFIRKGYDVVPSIDINSSVAKFKSILADFYSPDNSSFQTKKTINQNILSSLSGLINSKEESDYREKLKKEYKEQLEQAKKEGNQRNIDRINKKIEDLPKLKKLESRPVAEEILNFLGMSKNAIRLKSTGGRLSASNLMQGFSDLLGEPMLKGEPSENIYAILELNGDVEKVKIPKEIEHGSYPFAVKAKDAGNVVLHILQDRQNWKDNVLDPETNEKIVDNKRALELMPTTAGITFVPVKVSTSSNAQMSQGERGERKAENITIEPIDFENKSENIDVYEAEKKAFSIAKNNNVNILKSKDLVSVALDKNNNVVGGLWTEIDGNEFSFDVAIDKESQGKGIGEKLVNEAIQNFNSQDYDGELKYKIDVTNPIMEKLLLKYGFEVTEKIDDHTIMEHPTNNPKLKPNAQMSQGERGERKEVGEPLKDVRSTAKALEDVDGDALNKAKSNFIITKAENISKKSEYLNCDAFCHRLVNNRLFKDVFDKVYFNIKFGGKTEKVVSELQKILKVGDIIAFGDKNDARHYAVYLGDDSVYEVEGWGEKPRKYSLSKNIDTYTGLNNIYRDNELNKEISEAYHKAKKDGSNPELVKSVEELLGKPKEKAQMSQGEREIPQFSKGSRGRRAYDETGFISVPTMVEIVKSNNPNYLGHVMEHIIEMGDKLKKGAVTTSDLSKAYMMAVSSILSGDINVETFENAIGQKVDKVFLEPNNKIRTEGAMAYLLTTDRGADLIKHIESGKITKEDREFIANSMKPFGMFDEGQTKYNAFFGETSKDQINLTNINEFKDLLKNGVKSTDELFDKIRKLKQISQGKIGFVANFLGIGTRGVIDKREIQGWLRGTTFKGERSENEAEIEKQLNKNLVNLTPLQKEILDRMGEVGRALGVPENLAAYIGHHMIWDAVAGERTTHDGLYLAMKQNQQDFDSRLRELSEREKTNAQMSQGERGERRNDVQKVRDEAIRKFKEAGFDVLLGGVSETTFGKSAYFYVKRPDGTEQKVRVSDHGVLNPDRIFGEVHIDNKSANIDKAIIETKKKIQSYIKDEGKRASEFEELNKKRDEANKKWGSIKEKFVGKYFHGISRTYMDMDKFKEKHPEAENIVQKDLGNGAFSYEWASDKKEYGKEKPSDYYIEQQETLPMPEDIETEITDEEKDIILQAMNLYYDMRDNTKTAPQKKEIKREREKLLNENENIKRIFDNVQDINKQLQNKELITKKGDCL